MCGFGCVVVGGRDCEGCKLHGGVDGQHSRILVSAYIRLIWTFAASRNKKIAEFGTVRGSLRESFESPRKSSKAGAIVRRLLRDLRVLKKWDCGQVSGKLVLS
eukprot:TRINITY_DN5237_c1_g2_i2.p4 TRINITY_DN5237_c1_g2~~TRINITY_DN5237_c1_g2_i2.p4  ORF type:complete len:103 (-),score=15.19 TRINITY_DN5237_c1_g2_i2:764-1072(-)